jgi:branched-chain amino acid transport system permease protein
MPEPNRLRNSLLTLAGIGLLVLLLWFIGQAGSSKLVQAFALFAIWGVAAVSLNLINGITGILSLGHHGFMLVGGYTTALLILPVDSRERILTSGRSQMTPETLNLSIANLFRAVGLESLAGSEYQWLQFIIALLAGGLVAAAFGMIVGIPSLRLKGDYLAIVTLGFGEIIRLLAATSLFTPYTNGALGFAGVPQLFGKSIWWTSGVLGLTVFVMARIKFSSYGRVMQGIREDEVASEAMGVNVAYNKILAFVLSAFFAGIAGGLWVSWIGTARVDQFLFTLTFFFLVAVSVGGTGSITGVLLGTALVVFIRQYGDPLEQTYPLTTWVAAAGLILLAAALFALLYRFLRRYRPRWHASVWLPGALGALTLLCAWLAPSFGLLQGSFRGFGLRAILLSVILVVIMIFRPEGIMGRAEFSWAALFGERRDRPTDEERGQDAWLSNPELKERLGRSAGNPRQARPGDLTAKDDA